MAMRTGGQEFRHFFARGLGIVLPSVLTLWLLWQASVFVFKNVAVPINRGVQVAVIDILPLVVRSEQALPGWFRVAPERVEAAAARRAAEGQPPISAESLRRQVRKQQFREIWDRHWWMQGSGILVAIILIYLAGRLVGGILGRRLYERVEALIGRIPGFKQVYPHVKQMVDMILGDRPIAFKRVVAVEYPRKGIWTVAFVTGRSMKAIHERVQGDCVSLFVPTSPIPFTGFAITVPSDEVIELPITVEEAIRFVVTAGMLVAESQAVARLDPAEEARLKELVERRLRST